MRYRTNRTNTKSAAFLWPWILLAAAGTSLSAGGPASDAPAKACLRLESRSAVPGTPGCTKSVDVRNSCDVHVVADIRRTQHLFSGTSREVFPVVIPAGGEVSLGCAWWSGAMAPAEHELVAARFFEAPIRRETREPCSDRR